MKLVTIVTVGGKKMELGQIEMTPRMTREWLLAYSDSLLEHYESVVLFAVETAESDKTCLEPEQHRILQERQQTAQ